MPCVVPLTLLPLVPATRSTCGLPHAINLLCLPSLPAVPACLPAAQHAAPALDVRAGAAGGPPLSSSSSSAFSAQASAALSGLSSKLEASLASLGLRLPAVGGARSGGGAGGAGLEGGDPLEPFLGEWRGDRDRLLRCWALAEGGSGVDGRQVACVPHALHAQGPQQPPVDRLPACPPALLCCRVPHLTPQHKQQAPCQACSTCVACWAAPPLPRPACCASSCWTGPSAGSAWRAAPPAWRSTAGSS